VGSHFEQKLLESLSLTTPSVIIPNGVFFEEIDPLPRRGTFRNSRPTLRGRRYLLFLGRLHHKKGLDVLGKAFARIATCHADVDLVVVGPDGGARQPFEELMSRLQLRQRVHFLGPLFGVDKYAALVDAECFCLPSRQEGFSVAIIESLACGTPVVISEGCHFPEVAETGAGAVIELDSIAVATAIDRVLSNPDVRRKQGIAARRLIEERYTWPDLARRTVSLYESVMDSIR
jgi:glycosyltransferase involved in cell wall biosynthesis